MIVTEEPNNSNTAIVVPSRLSSKRLPRKALVKIDGDTLITHVIRRCLEADVGHVIAAVGEEELAEHIEKVFGGGVKIILTGVHGSGTASICHAINWIDPMRKTYKYVINVQGDMPFIDPHVIRKSRNSLYLWDLLTPVDLRQPLPQSESNKESKVKTVIAYDSKLKLPYCQWFTRQPIQYGYRHYGIYAFTRTVLDEYIYLPQREGEKAEKLEQLRFVENGYRIGCFHESSELVDVNVPEDLKKLESLGHRIVVE